MKELEWFEWFVWFGPSPIEPFNLGEATRAVAARAARAASETAEPVAIVPLSGLRRKGIRILREGLETALAKADEIAAGDPINDDES